MRLSLPIYVYRRGIIGSEYSFSAAVGHWNSYFSALLYLPDQKLQPVQIYLMKVLIEQTEEALGGLEDVGIRASLAAQMKYTIIIIVVLPILCVYPFLQKYFIKGVMIGAIKE